LDSNSAIPCFVRLQCPRSGSLQAHSFDQTMEATAYTWFNRFVAIRYMELHGYLDHGYRVLSHPEAPGRPEILDHAADVELPGDYGMRGPPVVWGLPPLRGIIRSSLMI
jgi:hypothetical protein